MKSFEEYVREELLEKSDLYKELTGREPSEDELLEFLLSEYNDDLIKEIKHEDEFTNWERTA